MAYNRNKRIDGSFTFEFVDNNMVKICGGKEIDLTNDNNFYNFPELCMGLKNCRPKLTLNVDNNGVILNGKKYTADFFRSKKFWESVKSHHCVFDNFKDKKFKIASENNKIKIEDFLSDLDTNNIVFGYGLDEGWGCIFKENWIVDFDNMTYQVIDGVNCDIKDPLGKNLRWLVELVLPANRKKNDVKIKGIFKMNWSGDGEVNLSNKSTLVVCKDRFWLFWMTLSDLGNCGINIPKIKLKKDVSGVFLDDVQIKNDFVKSPEFDNCVKKYSELFDFVK